MTIQRKCAGLRQTKQSLWNWSYTDIKQKFVCQFILTTWLKQVLHRLVSLYHFITIFLMQTILVHISDFWKKKKAKTNKPRDLVFIFSKKKFSICSTSCFLCIQIYNTKFSSSDIHKIVLLWLSVKCSEKIIQPLRYTILNN